MSLQQISAQAELPLPERRLLALTPTFRMLRGCFSSLRTRPDRFGSDLISLVYGAAVAEHYCSLEELIHLFSEADRYRYHDVISKLAALQQHFRDASRDKECWSARLSGCGNQVPHQHLSLAEEQFTEHLHPMIELLEELERCAHAPKC